MSWQERDTVSLRKEFILQALQEDSNITNLCRRYGVSRKTGYKWIQRYRSGEDLTDQSRRPKNSKVFTEPKTIEGILKIRSAHPSWGARKIQAVLRREKITPLPAASTIHKLLQQHGCITDRLSSNNHYIRFEHEQPNHLWQMDFKGHFAYEKGRCHPLTILDDHSRFSIALQACSAETGEAIKPLLVNAFRQYGMPDRINVDNGNPWGSVFATARYTTFSK